MNSDINVASSNVNGMALRQASVQSTYASIWDELKRETGSTMNATKNVHYDSLKIIDIHHLSQLFRNSRFNINYII